MRLAVAIARVLPVLLVAAACSASVTETDETLKPRLIGPPEAGGPWTLEDQRSNPIDVLDPVCGVELPEARPFSIGHAGTAYLGGEPYPVLIHIADRFRSPADAAGIVELHRAAADECETWTFEDSRGVVAFSVRPLDVGPPGSLALEVLSDVDGSVLVTHQIMFADGDVIEFLAHIGEESLEPGAVSYTHLTLPTN